MRTLTVGCDVSNCSRRVVRTMGETRVWNREACCRVENCGCRVEGKRRNPEYEWINGLLGMGGEVYQDITRTRELGNNMLYVVVHAILPLADGA
jgi:hypothetical protein